jgi:hypothetical protein
MTTRLSKTVIGLVAATTLTLSATAFTTPAQAHWHGGCSACATCAEPEICGSRHDPAIVGSIDLRKRSAELRTCAPHLWSSPLYRSSVQAHVSERLRLSRDRDASYLAPPPRSVRNKRWTLLARAGQRCITKRPLVRGIRHRDVPIGAYGSASPAFVS